MLLLFFVSYITSEHVDGAMPRVVSHDVKGGVALSEPLSNGVDFPVEQLGIGVARQKSIHQRIQQRKKPPRHGKHWRADVE